MSGTPKNPAIGDLHIDASDLAAYIVDLAPGAMQGLRIEKEGLPGAIAEIMSNQALYGDKAGITQGDISELTSTEDRIHQIDTFLGPARKLVEMLDETRALLGDQRERLINAFARSVDGRAKTQGGAELLARYEQTRAYRSLTANKAAKTREKNKQAAEAQSKPKNAAPNPTAPPDH
jgi:hypothetical protein